MKGQVRVVLRHLRSVYLDVPTPKVFEFWVNPLNWATVPPPGYLTYAVRDLHPMPDGAGTTYVFRWRLRGGIELENRGEIIHVAPDRRIVTRETGSLPGTSTYLFEPVGEGTVLTALDELDQAAVDRIPLLGRLAVRAHLWHGGPCLHLLTEHLEGRTSVKR